MSLLVSGLYFCCFFSPFRFFSFFFSFFPALCPLGILKYTDSRAAGRSNKPHRRYGQLYYSNYSPGVGLKVNALLVARREWEREKQKRGERREGEIDAKSEEVKLVCTEMWPVGFSLDEGGADREEVFFFLGGEGGVCGKGGGSLMLCDAGTHPSSSSGQ